MKTPILSVIIVNWNTRDLLDECLSSINGKLEIPSGGELETIVVDNASVDGSAKMVKQRYPWVKLLENESNVGFAQANNQAIPVSSGKYVLLLNSDTRVHPGAFETLVDFMEQNPTSGACGARPVPSAPPLPAGERVGRGGRRSRSRRAPGTAGRVSDQVKARCAPPVGSA